MIIIQLYLAFLCFGADGFLSNEDPDCQDLVNEFNAVMGFPGKICLIIIPRGKYVHINITTKNPGHLLVDGTICNSEATKDVQFDVEYVDLTFRLTTLAPNETCPLDSVGAMQMVFRSISVFSAVEFSVKVIENYENNKNGTLNSTTEETEMQAEDEITTTIAMVPQLTISDNTTEVWEQKNKEMNTTVAMIPESSTTEKPSEFLNEFRIILITGFGVVFILLLVFLCFYKFVDYKFKSRLRTTENELEQIRHNQIFQGIELSVLSKNEPDHSANLEPSDHSDNSMFELNSHSP